MFLSFIEFFICGYVILVLFRFCVCYVFFFFKQKTAYEMRISDWSSDVCSSDLVWLATPPQFSSSGRAWPDRLSRGLPGDRAQDRAAPEGAAPAHGGDRKSVVSGKSVSVRVDLGGRRIIKKKIIIIKMTQIQISITIRI